MNTRRTQQENKPVLTAIVIGIALIILGVLRYKYHISVWYNFLGSIHSHHR